MNEGEKQRNYDLADKLISEQNFAAAVVAGAVATLGTRTAELVMTDIAMEIC